jgi:hypothetical protein
LVISLLTSFCCYLIFFTDEPNYWWFELTILLNKTMMCGGLVVLNPGSPTQIVCAILIMLFHLLLVLKTAPYERDSEDWTAFLSSLGLTLTYVGALIKMLQEQRREEYDSNELEYANTALNILPIACVSIVVLIMVFVDCGLWNCIRGKKGLKDGKGKGKGNNGSLTQVQPVNVEENQRQQSELEKVEDNNKVAKLSPSKSPHSPTSPSPQRQNNSSVARYPNQAKQRQSPSQPEDQSSDHPEDETPDQYTPVSSPTVSPNENNIVQENLRYETISDIEKFERIQRSQQRSVVVIEKKTFAQRNRDRTQASNQRLAREREEEEEEERRRVEEYREKLNSKIVKRVVVKRDTGYTPTKTKEIPPNTNPAQTRENREQQQQIKRSKQKTNKSKTNNNTQPQASAAFGRAPKKIEDDLTPEERQKVKEQRALKRKAFEERNRQQLLQLQQKKQKEKDDVIKKEMKLKQRRFKLREAAKRAAGEAAVVRFKN